MNKRIATVITMMMGLIAVALPTVLSILLARNDAINSEKALVLSYALDVLSRSEAVVDQMDAGIKKLSAAGLANACAPGTQALMKQIDLSSSYIQAIGHVSGTSMICSSLGAEVGTLELGPVDMVRPNGTKVRLNVEFPFAKGSRFLVVERDGFAAIVHKDLPLDVTTNIKGVSLAVLAYPERRPILSRGEVNPAWLNQSHEGDATFVYDDFVIAVVPPKRYLIGAVAAIPAAELNRQIYATSIILVPIGLAASLVLAWVISYLVKLRIAMPTVIKSALKKKEFFLEYQPVVDLATGKWTGAEALIRWQRMKHEVIRPDIFIPVAEESGQIKQITRYVAGRIRVEAAGLFRQYPDFHIGINLSAADLHDESTILMMRELAAATGARPGNIVIEATERSFTDHDVAGVVINKLRAEGFPVAIDDFGTGYSSLAYLDRVKLDFLKIDKSFVDTLNTDAPTSEVILHIIDMAKALKLSMIAEGVETEAQADFLRAHGVQYAQGWLFAKSMSFSDLLAGLAQSGERRRDGQ